MSLSPYVWFGWRGRRVISAVLAALPEMEAEFRSLREVWADIATAQGD